MWLTEVIGKWPCYSLKGHVEFIFNDWYLSHWFSVCGQQSIKCFPGLLKLLLRLKQELNHIDTSFIKPHFLEDEINFSFWSVISRAGGKGLGSIKTFFPELVKLIFPPGRHKPPCDKMLLVGLKVLPLILLWHKAVCLSVFCCCNKIPETGLHIKESILFSLWFWRLKSMMQCSLWQHIY